MLIVAALSFLIGILLGLRFRVLILIPATAIVLAGVAGMHSAAIGLAAMPAAIAALQIGYLVGAFIALHLRRPVGGSYTGWAHASSLPGG
jgi:hypothetical protein